MPSVEFTGTKGKVRVNYTEVSDVPNNKSYIYIDSVQIMSTVFSGVVYYACGKVSVGGQVVLDMDGESTYTSGYVESTGVWYTIANTEVRTPITVFNDGKGRTTTIGLGPHGSYNDFNVFCISDSRGNIEITAQSKTINLYRLPTYTLSISAGTGSQIVVRRNGVALSNGDTLYQGDSLIITFGTSIGYDLATHSVNGVTFSSGDSHTVTSAVSVVSSATVKQFSLTIDEGTGTQITVTRTYSPIGRAEIGTLSDGDILYYSDVISISVSVMPGYILQDTSMNGGSIQTPYSVTVDVELIATAIAAGAYIRGNSSFDMYQILIKGQQIWDLYRPVVYNGTSWESY